MAKTCTLASIVGPALQNMFPWRELKLFAGNNIFAVFPAIHPDVGDIQIFDDGDEVRVEVGRFTHTHFGPSEEGVTWKEDGERIANEVIAFLGNIFDHKVKFYVTPRTGGCEPIGSQQGAFSKAISGPHQYFVWSGLLIE